MKHRAKGKGKGKIALPDPLDVLAGRAAVTPRELLRLIHRVNPTSEQLSRGEAAPRYKLKAALQSLLIRRCGEDLRVETDPAHPELIGLRLRPFDEDACHAILDELDVDGRFWAQRRIDEMATAVPESSPAPCSRDIAPGAMNAAAGSAAREPSAPDELVRAGLAALEQYDYETGETYLTRAFMASCGDVQAAVALFEFYVDSVAAYEKVAHLEGQLSPAARQDDQVKALLALAAARRGEPDMALRFAARTTSSRIPEVLFLAAGQLMKRGDDARAEETLRGLVDLDAPAFRQGVAGLLEELKARRLAPLEQEMLAAWDTGRKEDALAAADRLLVRCPEHKAALKLRRECDKERRVREIADCLARADAARHGQDLSAEAFFLENAATLGARAETVQARLLEVREALLRARREAVHESVRHAWIAGHRKEALLKWWELPADQRACVAQCLGAPHTDWLELIMAEGTRADRAVEAVLALERAMGLEESDAPPDRVIAELEHHAKALLPVPLAEAILRRAGERAMRIEASTARELLRHVETHLAREEPENARALLGRIKLALLDPQDREAFAALTSRLEARERRRRLTTTYETAAAADDHFRAREAAQKLATTAGADPDGVWRRAAETHGARIRSDWALPAFDIRTLPFSYLEEGLSLVNDTVWEGLAPDAKNLLFTASFGSHLLLATYDIESRQMRRGIVLRSPQPMSFVACKLFGKEVWVESAAGRVVVLTLDPLDVLAWYDLNEMRAGRTLEHAWVSPGSRVLWLDFFNRRETNQECLELVNLDTRRLLRRYSISGIPYPVKTRQGFLVAVDSFDTDRLHLLAEHGRIQDDLVFPTRCSKDCASPHPNGTDLIFLTSGRPATDATPEAGESENGEQLALEVRPDRDGRYTPTYIATVNGNSTYRIATALADSLLAVLWWPEFVVDPPCVLAVFRITDSGFDKLYQVPLAEHSVLVTDEFSQRVAVCTFTETGPQVTVLTHLKPALPDTSSPLVLALPDAKAHRYSQCDGFLADAGSDSLDVMRALRDLPGDAVRAKVEQLKVVAADNPVRNAAIALALEHVCNHEMAREEWDRIDREFAHNDAVRIAQATRAARRGEWQSVADLLGDLPQDRLTAAARAHYCHLLGLTAFFAGDLREARRTWSRGILSLQDPCALSDLVAYVDLLLDPDPRSACRTVPDMPSARALSFLFDIEHAIGAEDWEGAQAVIDRQSALPRRDRQLLARCAEVFLHRGASPPDPVWIRTLVIFDRYVEIVQNKDRFPLVPPGIPIWPEERLDAIARLCRRWLETPDT